MTRNDAGFVGATAGETGQLTACEVNSSPPGPIDALLDAPLAGCGRGEARASFAHGFAGLSDADLRALQDLALDFERAIASGDVEPLQRFVAFQAELRGLATPGARIRRALRVVEHAISRRRSATRRADRDLPRLAFGMAMRLAEVDARFDALPTELVAELLEQAATSAGNRGRGRIGAQGVLARFMAASGALDALSLADAERRIRHATRRMGKNNKTATRVDS